MPWRCDVIIGLDGNVLVELARPVPPAEARSTAPMAAASPVIVSAGLAESAANEQAGFSAASDSVRFIETAETSTRLSNPAVACANALAAAALDLHVVSTGTAAASFPIRRAR